MVPLLLFKILQMFLLPTVFVFVLILIGLILISREKRKNTGKWLIVIGLLFYYIFSITPTADLILKPLESQYSRIEENEIALSDKIVLLSGAKERLGEVLRVYNKKLQLSGEKMEIIISGRYPLSLGRNEAE